MRYSVFTWLLIIGFLAGCVSWSNRAVPSARIEPLRPVSRPVHASAPPRPAPRIIVELVDRLTGGSDLGDAVAATQEALVKSGVAIAAANGVYLVPPIPPVAPIKAIPVESWLLARDARQRGMMGRFTVDDLGRMLRDLGFFFAPGATPGHRIVQFLSAKVRAAELVPTEPGAFPWLFLAEMAERKLPPIDLRGGAASPERIRFNHLELQIFTAALFRGVPLLKTHADHAAPRRAHVASVQTAFDVDVLVSRNAGNAGNSMLAWERSMTPRPDACSALLDNLLPPRPGSEGSRDFGKDLIGTAAKEIIEQLMGQGLSKAEQEKLGNATDALNILMRAQKLYALSSWTELTVTASETSIHKPDKDSPPKLVLLTASAGINGAEWAALQKLGNRFPGLDRLEDDFKDCMTLVGPAMYTDREALAKEAENWHVAWEIRPKATPHVQIKLGGSHPAEDENVFDFPGLRQNKLRRVSGASAATELKLLVLPEDVPRHQGQERTAYVDVCALLKTESLPSLGVIVDAIGGGVGLAAAVFELTTSFWRTFRPETICTALEIRYHERLTDYKVAWTGFRGGFGIAEGIKCDGPGGEWKIRLEWREPLGIAKGEIVVKLDRETLIGTLDAKVVENHPGRTCTRTLSATRVYLEHGQKAVSIKADGHYQTTFHCIDSTGHEVKHSHTGTVGTLLHALTGDFCDR